MEKAKDYEDLIYKISEQLQCLDKVYYNVDTLEFEGIFDEWISEFEDNMYYNEPTKFPDGNLLDRPRNSYIDINDIIQLKSTINKPESYVVFNWMEDFVETHSDNLKFVQDAVLALRKRHPFRGFRMALDWNRLTEEWYQFRDSKMEDYVRKNI